MGKNNKDASSNVNVASTPNRDILQRLNFMYQASVYLHSCSSPSKEEKPIRIPPRKSKNARRTKPSLSKKQTKSLPDIAQFYANAIPIVAQRTTVKMDPSIKRTLCKTCKVALIPGVSVSTRVRALPSHTHIVLSKCLNCSTTKRTPAPPLALPSTSIPTQDMPMDVDPPQLPVPTPTAKNKKNPPHPRIPPLFARTDAGHFLFCGNERVQGGDL